MLMYPLPAAPTPHGIERAGGFYGWIPVLNLCQELQLGRWTSRNACTAGLLSHWATAWLLQELH